MTAKVRVAKSLRIKRLVTQFELLKRLIELLNE